MNLKDHFYLMNRSGINLGHHPNTGGTAGLIGVGFALHSWDKECLDREPEIIKPEDSTDIFGHVEAHFSLEDYLDSQDSWKVEDLQPKDCDLSDSLNLKTFLDEKFLENLPD
jgi:hypothetical protein